ncbi:SSI family serine proteinase inhibitor [Qaidamihabitans albus]|uniref:SSI family serine proteinase inhibitor n=1 Tax=Qaidamihabitans albus TaxID=2795733 RepID=UPI0018F1EE99|nr:SSI family serine proteinase inhibitor [Qaidamihabitans albus]
MPIFSAGSLAACAVTLMCAGGQATPPGSSLVLTLHPEGGTPRSAVLLCDPASGTHPEAEAACDALEQADGDFARLPTEHRACPMIHAPVRAEAHGTWRGERVHFRTSYSNTCFAEAESSGVFAI